MSRKISSYFAPSADLKLKVIKQEKVEVKEDQQTDVNFSQNFNITGNIKTESDMTFEITITSTKPCNKRKRKLEEVESNVVQKKQKLDETLKDNRKGGKCQMKSNQKNNDDKLITCDLCNTKLQLKLSMLKHMQNIHAGGRVRRFECDFCEKIFFRKRDIYYHVFIHMKLVECHICKAMLKPMSLPEHLTDVHAEKSIKCGSCDKMFKAKKDLIRHQKTHDKKFSCKDCAKKFRLEYDLNQHIYFFHENPKSFSCDICEKRFNEKICLKRHKIRHDNNKPKDFKCMKCKFETNARGDYKKHMKTRKHMENMAK